MYMQYPKEIILVRHGESEANVLSSEERTKLDSSTKDYALTAKGRLQAMQAGAYLRATYPSIDAYYTSYCRRTKETMEIMFPHAKIVEDARIGEAQRGIWHDMSEKDIDEHFPFERARRAKEGIYYYRPFGGENWPDLEIRIHSFIETLFRQHRDERIVLCVHGHWHIAFQRIMHNLSTEETIDKYHNDVAPNGSITVYKGTLIGGKPQLTLVQQTFTPPTATTANTPTVTSPAKFQYQHQSR
jgi:broad specificity phosphatase PhoE